MINLTEVSRMSGMRMELASAKVELADALAEVSALKDQIRWRKYPEEKPDKNDIYLISVGCHLLVNYYQDDKFVHICPTKIVYWMPISEIGE